MPVVVVSLVALFLGFFGSVPLAGPVSVMVVSRAAMGRFREALKLAFGASAAESIYAAVAFWGFATLLADHPRAVPFAHGITAVTLLVVGAYFVRWSPKEEPVDDEKPRAARGAFVLGFTASVFNPTLLLTWGAVTTAIYARQIVPLSSHMAIPFGLAAGAGVALWNVVLVALLERFHSRIPTHIIRWVVRGMGVMLIAIAVWSAFDLLRRA